MLLCVADESVPLEPLDLVTLANCAGMRARIWRVTGKRAALCKTENDFMRDVPVEEVIRSKLTDSLASIVPVPDAILLCTEDVRIIVHVLWWATTSRVPVLFASERTLNAPSPVGLLGTATVLVNAAIASLFDGFLTPGILGQQYLLSLGVPHDSIACGLRAIDIKKWEGYCLACRNESQKLRASWDSQLVILSITPLEEDQNPMITLGAIARLMREFESLKCVHVGEGKLEGVYQKRARQLGITDSLSVIAPVESNELAAYYCASDMVVHCPKSDASGSHLLEAMACARPVVAASSVGLAAELIIHGTTGAIAYQGDVDSLVEGLRLIVTSNPKQAGEAAKRMVERKDVRQAGCDLGRLITTVKSRRRRTDMKQVARRELLNQYGRWWL